MRGYTAPTLPEEESIIWGDDTGRVLPGIQYQLFGLLRRSMDRQTGIAGDYSSISYGGLYERLYQANAQGVAGTGDAWGKTRDQRVAYIRQQLRQLEKTGLIKRLARGKKLVVEFSIFIQVRDQYFSVQNVSSGFAPVTFSGFAPPKNINEINNLEEKNADFSGVCSGADSGVCSTSPEVSRSYIHTDRGNPRFPLSVDWRPSPSFADLARLSMLDIQGEHQSIYGETLAEFLLFWTGAEAMERYPLRLQRTQSEWERGLLAQLHSAKANPKARQTTPVTPSRPFRIATKQDALRARNKQVFDNWIPPELREGANA